MNRNIDLLSEGSRCHAIACAAPRTHLVVCASFMPPISPWGHAIGNGVCAYFAPYEGAMADVGLLLFTRLNWNMFVTCCGGQGSCWVWDGLHPCAAQKRCPKSALLHLSESGTSVLLRSSQQRRQIAARCTRSSVTCGMRMLRMYVGVITTARLHALEATASSDLPRSPQASRDGIFLFDSPVETSRY
jgi:hypothetical protein